MNFFSRPLNLLLGFLICSFTPLSAYADIQNNNLLYQLINTRLSHMKAVAWYKWEHKLPIEDLAREQLVIEKSIIMAKEHNLSAQRVVPFFKVQIELAKKIQNYYQLQWAQSQSLNAELNSNINSALISANRGLPTLAEIRPELITLGQKIIGNIAGSDQVHDFYQFSQAIKHPALELNDKALLFYALSQVKPLVYSSRLDRIIAEKILYVGTTGDYEPFSFYDNKTRTRTGIDIDLANKLAASLGAVTVFLPTSWPSLLTDLASHRVDIMMSGISKKLFRQQQGVFSAAYFEGGKTPISLCSQAHKFNSLINIDQSATRIIVNKGGTNQRFVEQNIKQASIIVHDDNVTVFEQLLAKKADVMITDQIEVAVQAKKHPELCGTMPNDTLSYSSKAFLMERDWVLKEYVNTWLEIQLKDGTVKRILNKYH